MRFGAVLAVAVILIACSAIAQAQTPETTGEPTWWLPQPASTHADAIVPLFNVVLVLTGAVLIGVFVVLAVFLVRYRHRPGRRAVYVHGNLRLEAVWTLVPALILVVLAAYSQQSWSLIKTPPPTPKAAQVRSGEQVLLEVVGMQFKWYFHYPGADGILGPLSHAKIDANSQEIAAKIGLDRSHPAAKDDFCTDAMHVPVGRKIVFRLTSVDVLHSFWVPNLYFKQDAVPGLAKLMWFEPTRTSAELVGTWAGGDPKPFDIVCAELCGQGHYTMRGQLYVVAPPQYKRWYQQHVTERAEEEAY